MELRAPDIAVVVASHDRPLRLRWLLNALEDQTLPRERFEVLVGHDSRGEETEALLAEHPLVRTGTLRHERLPAGTAPPGANRNAAWRLARAPIIAFTDDDCRPPPHWLEKALAAARRHPCAVVQGKTVPDPLEEALLDAPIRHTQRIHPPSPYAQACNIVYPRDLLERLDGFDEALYTGEDTELGARARKLGAAYVAAPEAVTYHSVIPMSLMRQLRSLRRWQDLPAVVKRHPELRADFPLWVFWHRRHVWLPLALAGALLERRNPLYALLAFPYLMHAFPSHGLKSPRGRLRSLIELPSWCARDLMEMGVLARGSMKARTLLI